MAIGLEDGTLIWIDAVTSFTETLSAQVSSHPISAGAKVTDHRIRENTEIQVSGVWSDADFNNNRPLGYVFMNNQSIVTPGIENVSIAMYDLAPKYLPESISQYLGTGDPDVKFNNIQSKPISAKMVADRMRIAHRNGDLMSLYSFFGNILEGVYINCQLINFTMNETPETGDCVEFSMSLEQIEFAYSVEVAVKRKEKKSSDEKIEKKTDDKVQCGNQGTKTNNTSTPTNGTVVTSDKDASSLSSGKTDLTSNKEAGK